MSEALERISRLSPQRLALLVLELQSRLEASEGRLSEPIAIIGMGCRFPGGAKTPAQFWELLRNGVDAVTEVPPARWDVNALYDPDPNAPGKMSTRWGGFIDDVDLFDPQFFGIAPREAIDMDPQQRLLLEVSWEALENAGYAPDQLAGSATGVFVGLCTGDYHELQLGVERASFSHYMATGAAPSIASGRLSYTLGLQGPSISVDTACSASLVSVHLAVQSLRMDECRMALAGGVNLVLSPEETIMLTKGNMMAADGRCKAFDASGDGFVRADGCGVVVLKRLSDALADRDNVLAVIRGSALNQDGRSNGLTAPNGPSQEAVIRRALANANVTPGQVGFVETHGSGTSLGDPIEVQALGAVYGKEHSPDRPLAIGSVKSNIGHAEGAAGIAGLIKAVLALQHGEIPPHLHFKTPNPYVAWDQIPVVVPTHVMRWDQPSGHRMAGVSSFGFSGTNAHIIVEEMPAAEWQERLAQSQEPGVERPSHILCLSGKTEPALRELAARFRAYLDTMPAEWLPDAAYTANAGRAHLSHRLAVTGADPATMRAALAAYLEGRDHPHLFPGAGAEGRVAPAFLFAGQGTYYMGMGRQLYETQPAFRKTLDECDALLRSHLELPLLSVLYPPAGSETPLQEMEYMQPAIFALEYALAQLWRSFGVEPAVVAGHSLGEYVAACIAGVFNLEDGLRLVTARGKLLQSLPADSEMVSVFADEATVEQAIAPYSRDVSLAAINSPEVVVISGRGEAVRQAVADLTKARVKTRRLPIARGAHSPLIDPILDQFEAVASKIRFSTPRIPFASCLTGQIVNGPEVTHAGYWRRHLRDTVRFEAVIRSLYESGYRTFLEIGPTPSLIGLGQRCLPQQAADTLWLASLRQGKDDWQQALESLAALYAGGAHINWEGFDRAYPRRRLPLPTYPFQRQRYWLNYKPAARTAVTEPPAPSPRSEHDFYALRWRRADRRGQETTPTGGSAAPWLILADAGGVGERLAGALRSQDHPCIVVERGTDCERTDAGHYRIDPARPEHFAWALEQALGAQAPACRGVVYLWGLDATLADDDHAEQLRNAQLIGCGGLLHLAQAAARVSWRETPRIWVVSRGAQAIEDGRACPGALQAPMWGLGHVIGTEHAELWGGLIDLDPAAGPDDATRQIRLEVAQPDGNDEVAFRGGQRFVARLSPDDELKGDGTTIRFHAGASYLISGGLGSLGLDVARWMVDHGARHLLLLGRRAPGESALRQIEALRAAGAQVLVSSADITAPTDLARALAELNAAMPPLRGVVHAAGAVDDGLVVNQTWTRFSKVTAPKIEGAWNLHRQTRDLPLDFFVMFSSVSCLIGSPGVANYAAANAFLNAFAHYRRAHGLPATTVDWSVWVGGGMGSATSDRVRSFWDRQGLIRIERNWGMAALGRIIEQQKVVATVLPLEMAKFSQYFTEDQRPSVLREMLDAPTPQATAEPAKTGIAEQIRDAAPELKRDILLGYLESQVAKILGFESEAAFEANRPLNELGLDSVMAIQLKNRVERDLHVRIRMTDFLQGWSVAELAGKILPQLEQAGHDGQPAPDKVPTAGNVDVSGGEGARQLLEQLGDLPDDQVDALLKQLLSEQEGS